MPETKTALIAECPICGGIPAASVLSHRYPEPDDDFINSLRGYARRGFLVGTEEFQPGELVVSGCDCQDRVDQKRREAANA